MMFTGRETLRFVTFALVAGGILGTLTTAWFFLEGITIVEATVASLNFVGAFALVLHLILRRYLDSASEPLAEPPTEAEV